MKTFVSACLAALAVADGTGDLEFTSIGQIKSKHAAFIQTTKFEDSEDFILVTAFSGTPWATGSVSIIPGIKDAVVADDVSSLKAKELDTGKIDFKWPNNAQVVPHDVFNSRAIVVPDGFLPPGHKNGGVYVISVDPSDITATTGTVKI